MLMTKVRTISFFFFLFYFSANFLVQNCFAQRQISIPQFTTLDEKVNYNVAGVYGGFGMMYVAGVISGLLGIGSGIFKVMAMDLFMKLPLKVSSATSNFMIGVTAAASAGVYLLRGDIDPKIAAPVALGVLIGATMGTKIMQNLKSKTIRLIFIPVLAYVSIQMIVKGIW
jgi:uncharacterized membrane protein YfcA